jgi:imidazolonepropionase-like amidohydrolase
MATIQGSTLWPAEALGIEKDYGSVEVGKVADFLIIAPNEPRGAPA